jgi:hypothetical protein
VVIDRNFGWCEDDRQPLTELLREPDEIGFHFFGRHHCKFTIMLHAGVVGCVDRKR